MSDAVTIEALLYKSSPIRTLNSNLEMDYPVAPYSVMCDCWVADKRCGDVFSKIFGCFIGPINPKIMFVFMLIQRCYFLGDFLGFEEPTLVFYVGVCKTRSGEATTFSSTNAYTHSTHKEFLFLGIAAYFPSLYQAHHMSSSAEPLDPFSHIFDELYIIAQRLWAMLVAEEKIL